MKEKRKPRREKKMEQREVLSSGGCFYKRLNVYDGSRD